MVASLYNAFGEGANESNSEQLRIHFKEKNNKTFSYLVIVLLCNVMKRNHTK